MNHQLKFHAVSNISRLTASNKSFQCVVYCQRYRFARSVDTVFIASDRTDTDNAFISARVGDMKAGN